MKNYILSVDAGVTSTKYAVIDVKNKIVVKKYKTEGMFFAFNNIVKLSNQIETIFYNLKKDFISINKAYLGISGIDSVKDLETFNKFCIKPVTSQYKNILIKVFNDTEFLFMFSKSKNVIAIISGTGSNCIGINKLGLKAKSGGLGAFLANQGSGYYVGLMGLQSAVKSFDGRGIKTVLEQKILNKYKAKSYSEVKEIIQKSSNWQMEIASLSREVVKCAELEDLISNKILKKASMELEKHITSVNKKLFKSGESFNVVASGNLFKANYVKYNFEKEVAKHNKNLDKIQFINKPHYLGPLEYIKNFN